MEKKDIIFALKLFIAGVLLGIFAGFLGVNPLGISQAQVIIALKSLFLGLGMITANIYHKSLRMVSKELEYSYDWVMKSHKAGLSEIEKLIVAKTLHKNT